jgi:amidase
MSDLSRRNFIGRGTACVLASVFQGQHFVSAADPTGAKPIAPVSNKLIYRSATELARLIRARTVSSGEVVQAHLDRIAAVNPRLRAVVQLDSAGALKAAREADAALARGDRLGPLHGVPVTIKDSFDTVGIISTGGTTGRSQFVPSVDAAVVKRLRAAGAIILGKTNTPELTLSYETDNLIYGRTNNPFDLARTCGGSSGGAAAILAVGGSPIDIGSDTAGSIRVPAHFCGIAGLKPTFGRVSRAGHIIPPGGLVGRMTHVGPMARFVEDLILLLPIISGLDSQDPEIVPAELGEPSAVQLKSLRTAFFSENGKSKPAADLVQAVQSATKVLADEGSPPEEKRLPGFDVIDSILSVINAGDGGDYYLNLLRQYGTTRMHPDTVGILFRSRSGVAPGRKYSEALQNWDRLKEHALKFMDTVDLLICPPCSAAAPKHGGTRGMDFSYCYMFNLLGWPAAVVRVGTTVEGLPIGVQIVGRPWKDHEVLAAALRIEKVLGGWKPSFPEAPLHGSG